MDAALFRAHQEEMAMVTVRVKVETSEFQLILFDMFDVAGFRLLSNARSQGKQTGRAA